MGFTVKEVEKIIREGSPGAWSDGGGLYLKVTPGGSASWQYRYQINDKRRMMGLGSVADVPLALARDKANAARQSVKNGIDPLEAKEAAKTEKKAAAVTFQDLASEYIESHRPSWRNAKHAQQWENTLALHAMPIIGKLPPAEIKTEHVLRILKPIWTAKPETASRLRNRIELVIDSARAIGLSDKPNPAAWRGHLDKLLPRRSKDSKGHHAAMDYRALPAFFRRLQDERDSLSSIALQITILTAARTSEVLMAEWREFDLDTATWNIPGARMKAGKLHRSPLSEAVVDLLRLLPRDGPYLFPGGRKGRPLSNMAMTMVLRRLGHGDLTVHGFRSAFRDWAAEETHYPNIVAEMALAHSVGDRVEAAYRRGDLLEKRRALMADWASYCTNKGTAENVVPIRSNTAA